MAMIEKHNDADVAVHFSFGAPPIRDGGKAGGKINRRHGATSASDCSPFRHFPT